MRWNVRSSLSIYHTVKDITLEISWSADHSAKLFRCQTERYIYTLNHDRQSYEVQDFIIPLENEDHTVSNNLAFSLYVQFAIFK